MTKFLQEPEHEQVERDDGSHAWVLKWKKEFVFELSGDMRELRYSTSRDKLTFRRM